MSLPYYDRIARKWHAITGAQGGAVKRFLLNDLVLDQIPGIAGRSILELGAGNGYFLPLVLRRFSGQVPARIVITDQSPALLDLAQRSFRVAEAEYRTLDVRSPLPFADGSFDLIVANMIFNELGSRVLRQTLAESWRVLAPNGRLVATVTHPAFVASLARRGELKPLAGPVRTMPGTDGLRLPVVVRRVEDYVAIAATAGFVTEIREVHPTEAVLAAKPGLRKASGVPIALLLACVKQGPEVKAGSAAGNTAAPQAGGASEG